MQNYTNNEGVIFSLNLCMSEKNCFLTLQAWPAWSWVGCAKLLTPDQHTSEIQKHPVSHQQVCTNGTLPHSCCSNKAIVHLRIHPAAYEARKRADTLSSESLTLQGLARLWKFIVLLSIPKNYRRRNNQGKGVTSVFPDGKKKALTACNSSRNINFAYMTM